MSKELGKISCKLTDNMGVFEGITKGINEAKIDFGSLATLGEILPLYVVTYIVLRINSVKLLLRTTPSQVTNPVYCS